MKYKILAVLAVLLMTLSVVPAVCAGSDQSAAADPEEEAKFLVDYGNGFTDWYQGSVNGPTGQIVLKLLKDNGIEASFDGSELVVDGVTLKTVGSTEKGGSLAVPGTTGVTHDVRWHFFRWDSQNLAWKEVDAQDASSEPLAIAYYPDGIAPVVSPVHRSAWTMIGADANNSFNTTVTMDSETATPLFECFPGSADTSGVYSSLLYAQGHILVKYGWTTSAHKAMVACYSQATGELEWKFYMPNCMLETTTALVVGDYVFIQTMGRVVYRVNYLEGPGEPDKDGNYPNVISMEGKAMKDITDDDKMPLETIEVIGKGYGYGYGSLIYSDGLIIGKAHNGMFYAFDTDLHLVWSYQTTGSNYFSSVSCVDGMVFGGTLDGYLYVLDVKDGSLIAKEQVKESTKKTAIQPMTPIIFREGANYRIFLTWSTTQMGSSNNGYAVYVFDPSAKTFENIVKVDQKGGVSNNMTAYSIDGKPATLLSTSEGVCSLASDGTLTVVSSYFKESYVTHAPFTLVNGNDLYLSTYQSGVGKENAQSIYLIHMDAPKKYYRYTPSTLQYAMAAVTVVDGLIMCGNDAGAYCLKGSLEEYTPPVIVKPTPVWVYVIYALIAVVAALAAIWCVLRFGLKWEKPFDEIKRRVMTYFYGEQYTHNTKSKRKLRVILLFGVAITVIMAIVSLCVGSERMLGPGEALGAMISSIAKGGRHLSLDEMLIYNQRLPRALAAISVGIGLSVAGAVYQAIIKNPLVEPYIMGVSSGAGTFAIAVMIYGFTFFGLFPEQSPYLIAVAAIFGGLLAFGLTLLLSLKTGGKPVNYVLSGIIIGLVFQAIQSVMMIGNGTKASNAISWLYGSFTSITWETIWVVMIPCILLSIIPLIWSKELNLVLLGEDQAMQMGLNAKRFDALMLVIVSVLTAFCVAFCGIIGFVGLVIPHLARLIIGGDHRLMLPVSMAFGGFLLLTADILSRVLLVGYELPVGAITTIIGVPVFAYLLIKRGRSYDG